MSVEGRVTFNGSQNIGRVSLLSARIGGSLNLGAANLKGATLDLRNASANTIVDNGLGSRPGKGNLYLDGFTYGGIPSGPRDAKTRLEWLKLQPDKPFSPQPYFQLAKMLQDAGDDDGARLVLVEMEDQHWKLKDDSHWTDPLERWPLRIAVGYGYHPLWALWEIVGLSAIGWIICRRGFLAGNIVPKGNKAAESGQSGFAPLIISIEKSLPLVNLGQGECWEPAPNAPTSASKERMRPPESWRPHLWTSFRWIQAILVRCGMQMNPDSANSPSKLSQKLTSARFLRWFLWIQILLGWLLATLFLAGVTGLVHK